jgi:hypothetical protein
MLADTSPPTLMAGRTYVSDGMIWAPGDGHPAVELAALGFKP